MQHRQLQAVLSAAVLLIVALAAASASAKDITGTPENDILPGTPRRDTIRGLAGNDTITPGKGDDRAFGDEGNDTFRWRSGDGHDRITGGADPGNLSVDRLVIITGRRLRLHLLGQGPGTALRGDLQVIDVRNIDIITIGRGQATALRGSRQVIGVRGFGGAILGTKGNDKLEISSDTDEAFDERFIEMDRGRDVVDASGMSADNNYISTREGEEAEADIVKGSARFFDHIDTGAGDDKIWTGAGGSRVLSGTGDDEIHLGPGSDDVLQRWIDVDRGGHDRVFGFAADDIIDVAGSEVVFQTPEPFDTNRNAWLDAGDEAVTLERSGLTMDLSAATDEAPGTTVVTLVGQTSIRLDQLVIEFVSPE
jgi:Ca2+-binding RTX toxin-like protein